MKQKTGLSEIAIANKIRQGTTFYVSTKREQKMAHNAAKFAGVMISTRADNGGWRIYFLHGSTK